MRPAEDLRDRAWRENGSCTKVTKGEVEHFVAAAAECCIEKGRFEFQNLVLNFNKELLTAEWSINIKH